MSGPPGDNKGLIIHGSNDATFQYRNHRGETAIRKVGVCSVWYGETEYHQGPQWFMHGLDLERRVFRDFAMKDMTDVTYERAP